MSNRFYSHILGAFLVISGTANAFDDFNIQMAKTAHEETSWRNDVYTTTDASNLWKSDCPWFQKPAATLRFNGTHQERFGGLEEIDLFAPMLDVSFQTRGGVNMGIGYQHGFLSEDQLVLGSFRTVPLEGESDSIGGYVTKQWDCGFKLVATWSYSQADIELEGGPTVFEFNTFGASGALGFARTFGEKRIGRNIFIDTSATVLYQSEQESERFLWLAKVGHNICPRVAVYGIFNLFHELDNDGRIGVPFEYAGYHPSGDETWGEAGGGLQAQVWRGLSLTAEATTPVLDEGFPAQNAFQVRAALNWRF
jgi:hypothetical protein